VIRRSNASNTLTVERIDSTGRRTPIIAEPGLYGWPSLSPDGRNLALSIVKSGVPTLALYTNVDHSPQQTWAEPGLDAAVWTRDGSALVARFGAGQRIVWIRAHGGEPRTVFEARRINVPWTFGPGDRQLFFAATDTTTAFDIWSVPIERNADSAIAGRATRLLSSRAYETYPAVSGDGRWLAYSSNEGGSPAVYVRSLRDTSVRVLVSPAGRAPRWSRSGQRLFFVTPNHRVMSASFTVQDGRFEAHAPRPWSATRLADTGVLPNYDVGADGSSIVALVPTLPPAINQVTVVHGLPRELRRRVSDR
jgi:Tol biopolymer transport system component